MRGEAEGLRVARSRQVVFSSSDAETPWWWCEGSSALLVFRIAASFVRFRTARRR